MKNYLEDNEFLAAYFQGSLPEVELTEFEQWLQLNPQKKAELEEYKLIWSATAALDANRQQSRRWEKLADALNEEKGREENAAPDWSPNLLYRIAASLLILFMAFSASYYFSAVEVTTPTGDVVTIQLPDGSTASINAESSLKYNKIAWKFGSRKITLQGEAYFVVVADGSSFSVQSDQVTTRVLGTQFNVYSRGNKVLVSCFEGTVGSDINGKEIEQVIINQGEFVSFQSESQSSKPIIARGQLHPLANSVGPGWIDGNYYFDKTPIGEILNEFERKLGIEITSNPEIDTIRFTGQLKLTTAEELLQIMSATAGLRYIKAGEDSYKLEME